MKLEQEIIAKYKKRGHKKFSLQLKRKSRGEGVPETTIPNSPAENFLLRTGRELESIYTSTMS